MILCFSLKVLSLYRTKNPDEHFLRWGNLFSEKSLTLFQEKHNVIDVPFYLRLVRKKHLDLLLNEPDFYESSQEDKGYISPEEVFNLVQVDGCQFQYLKIKNEKGDFIKPQVIEFYDTGSRYMFVLECYFSESSLNSVDLFRNFLLRKA